MNDAARAPLSAQQFGMVAASVTAAVLPHLARFSPWYVMLIAGVLFARVAQRIRNGRRIPAIIKLPLVLLFPVMVILHYGNVFGREPGAALACGMIVLKLVETETRRDARAAVAFSCFVLMSALLFEGSLGFTLLLFAALALLLATLRELEPRPAGEASPPWRAALKKNMASSAISLCAALPLCICVFLFFPRLGSPLWGAPVDTAARTGLGDSMAPSTLQELLIDDSPAFRVTFDSAVPDSSQRYWRGPVLTQFDGVTWTRSGWLSAGTHSDALKAQGEPISYEVTMEPTDRRWLLALDVPLTAPDDAVRGSDMTLVSRKSVDQLQRYRVTSTLHYQLDNELERNERERNLELPTQFDSRTRALGEHWRNTLDGDGAIIGAALALFRDQFFYTLSPPEVGHDSIDDFLFETHRGFCQHFASSFVFLMRAARIPARVVTGYQGGYFNTLGDYLIVRQSDAHAWAEVWLQGRGWVRVDPTAAVSPQRVELGARAAAAGSAAWYQPQWLLGLRNRLDLVNSGWNSLVVQFNALRQQSLLAPFGVSKIEYNELITLMIGSCTLLLGIFSWIVLRRPRGPTDPLDSAYARLHAKLNRAGMETSSAQGALTLASSAQVCSASSPIIQQLFENYSVLRYAFGVPPTASVRAFSQAVNELRVARRFSKFYRSQVSRPE